MRYPARSYGLKIVIMLNDNPETASAPHSTVSATLQAYRHFYQTLAQSGLTYYWPRFPTTQPCLVAEKPVFCATVLVLLEKPLSHFDHPQQKILHGMLQVLDRPADTVGVAWFEKEILLHTPPEALIKPVIEWAPSSLLLLGTLFKESLATFRLQLNLPIVQSEAPDTLAHTPSLKRAAYQDLLNLKSQLAS